MDNPFDKKPIELVHDLCLRMDKRIDALTNDLKEIKESIKKLEEPKKPKGYFFN